MVFKQYWLLKPFYWVFTLILFLCTLGLITWGSLAIYFSNIPWASLRIIFAIVFAVFGIWSLWFNSNRYKILVFALIYGSLLLWWNTILPTHERNWRPEVAVMPRAIINGDEVRITGYRDFQYRSKDDFTINYKERTVSLAHLTGIDFYISYWMPGPIGHTFLSFIFDNAPPITVSIETRPQVGQTYEPIGSLFKQFELIYVVGDENDLVRVRTNYRDEKVYLYHINISPENARKLFLVYLNRINQLADKAEFYHLLSNSCTINILRYANKAGRKGRLDFRHYLNGWIDSYLYSQGWLNTSIPFDELRSRSQINKAAQNTGADVNFSQSIRLSLPKNE